VSDRHSREEERERYTNFYTPKSTAGDHLADVNFSGQHPIRGCRTEVAGLDPAAARSSAMANHSRPPPHGPQPQSPPRQQTNIYSPGLLRKQETSLFESSQRLTIESQTNDRGSYSVLAGPRGLSHRLVSGSVTVNTARNYAMEIVTFK